MSKASTQEALDIKVFPATVHITTEQIADLHNTGVINVPAPGVGKMLLPLGMAGKMNAGATPFSAAEKITLGHGDFNVGNARLYESGSALLTATEDSDFIAKASGTALIKPSAELENQPLTLKLENPANATTGPISTFTVAGGGTGHNIGDTLQVTVGSGDAVFVVDTVDAGAILTGHLDPAGTDYSVENGVSLGALTGGGSGATIDITAITPPDEGDGDADVTVLYAEIPV